MNTPVTLTITSVLSILLFSLHLADDIVRGLEPGGLANLVGGSLISAVWLYGALVLTGRRAGYIILIFGSLTAMAVAVVHMNGTGVGVASGIATSSGGLVFVWTLIALGATGLFSVILAARELWIAPRGPLNDQKLSRGTADPLLPSRKSRSAPSSA